MGMDQVVQPVEPVAESAERSAFIKEWLERIGAAKKHHAPAFAQMKANMALARFGSDREWARRGEYRVPIIRRQVNQHVATLYARNPRAYVKPRDKITNVAWDGSPEALAAAQQTLMIAQQQALDAPPDGTGAPGPAAMPEVAAAEAIVDEAAAEQKRQQQVAALAKTLEILSDYYIAEQQPPFKRSLKHHVRRALVCRVAYVKLGFQRALQPNPEVQRQIADSTSELARLQDLQAQEAAGKLEPGDARIEELRVLLADLKRREFLIVSEGPVFDFPRSTEIIVDPRCRKLDGFVGAKWVAQEYERTREEIREIYKIDVGDKATRSASVGGSPPPDPANVSKDKNVLTVYEVWNKQNGQMFVICEGYDDYLRPPGEPDVKLERFWPYFTLIFNDTEDDEELYAPSMVEDLEHPQLAYNRAGQGLREHQMFNRPGYAGAQGALDPEDRQRLQNREAFSYVELKALEGGAKINDKLQALPQTAIDPALYDRETPFADMMRASGSQDANVGGLSGATATEVSVANATLSKASESDVDDLDDHLTELFSAMGQLLFMEVSPQTVQEIVGPGAQWPQFSREQVARDLLLQTEGGSSGRPNKSAKLADYERAMPYLVQFPGFNADPVIDEYADLLGLDKDKVNIPGLPSVVARNALDGRGGMPQGAPGGQPGAGSEDDPAAQGEAGADNAPAAQQNEPAGQPAYPASGGF